MTSNDAPGRPRPQAILFDLLMAVMNSPATWSAAANDPELAMAWRDAVTQRMREAGRYLPYDALVAAAASELRLPSSSVHRLRAEWPLMQPWPDATKIKTLSLPYAFVTNCSTELAREAAAASGLAPRFTLSAEEAGRFKPSPDVYRLACDRIGSVPERTLFVAGAPYDAEGAHAAGLRAILVRRRPVKERLDRQILVVDSLEAVRPETR